MKTKIPAELFNIAKIIDGLGGKTVIVGGYVRDFFLKNPSKDIDVEIYNLEMFKLTKVLEVFGKVDKVGKAFGVLKLKTKDNEYDFSLPRLDSNQGEKHTDVEVKVDSNLTFKQAFKRRDFRMNAIGYDVIRDVLSEGIILVPTYSYTFGKSLASHLANFTHTTPAEIGPFPNYVLKQSDAIRSIDPFMSVACIGKGCKELLSNLSNISYGEGSLFEKLVNLENTKCCSIGLGPNWTPFIHYADYLAKVPHRYDKLFWGKIDGKVTPWIYSVRFVGVESYPYAHIAGREAENKGIWKFENLGRARVYAASCKKYFNFVMDKLKQNPWYLAKGPAIDVIEKEGKFEIYGIIDVKEKVGQEVLGYKIIGTDEDLPFLKKKCQYALVTIGQIRNYSLRESLFYSLKKLALNYHLLFLLWLMCLRMLK
jgi:aminoglycoside N3'-acetyltransferase